MVGGMLCKRALHELLTVACCELTNHVILVALLYIYIYLYMQWFLPGFLPVLLPELDVFLLLHMGFLPYCNCNSLVVVY